MPGAVDSRSRLQPLDKARMALPVIVAALMLGGCAARSDAVGEPLTEQERIAAEVRSILADEDGIVPDDIEVEVRGGIVVLSGFQPELEPVSKAIRRIARVRGVTEVVNRIRIGSSPPTG